MLHKRNVSLFVGQLLYPSIQAERLLPSDNRAASYRLQALANSLNSVGRRCIVVSPAVAPRMGVGRGLCHSARVHRMGKVLIVHPSCLAMPVLGYLSALVTTALMTLQISKRYQIKSVLVYNYAAVELLAGIVLKYLGGLRVVSDIEDVCRWSFKRAARRRVFETIFQIYGWLLLNISLRVGDAITVPTTALGASLPISIQYSVIGGCVATPIVTPARRRLTPLHVLLSGAITLDNGAELFLAAARVLAKQHPHDYKFDVCGGGEMASAFMHSKLDNLEYHGNLTRQDYLALLDRADIAAVLQREGEYSKSLVPSKSYEYFAYGKAVICSRSGDFEQFPTDTCVLLEAWNDAALVEAITDITPERCIKLALASYDFASRNWSEGVIGKRLVEVLSI